MIFVLDSFLLPYLIETIAEHERRCLERMDAIIEHDDFAPMSGEELGKRHDFLSAWIKGLVFKF